MMPEQVDRLSVIELGDVIEARHKRVRADQKERIVQNAVIVQDLTAHVAALLPTDSKEDRTPPAIWDYYPDLFPAEKKQADEQKRKNLLERQKASMAAIMAANNGRHKRR